MRLLLDTHLLLWAVAEPHRLTAPVRDRVEDPANDILFSVASLWEIAITSASRRAGFTFAPNQIREAALSTGFRELPIHAAAAMHVATLPPHHRDPFDRLLVAQAITEPAHLLTADASLLPYSELITLVG